MQQHRASHAPVFKLHPVQLPVEPPLPVYCLDCSAFLVAITPVYYVTFPKQPDWTTNIPAEGQTNFSRVASGNETEEGVQAYGGSYSSVTYSGNIRNEIGVMRFPCNKITMSDGFEKQNLAPTVPKTAHANDLSLEICILLLVKSLHSSRDCWTCSRLCVRTL